MVTILIWGWSHNAYYMLPVTSSTLTSPGTWQFSMSQRIATFSFPLVEDGLLLLDPRVRCWIQRRISSPRDRSSHRWGSWGHCFLLTYLLLVKKKKMLFSSVTKQKPPTPETTFRKKQGSPNSPILEPLLPSLGRWEFLQMSAIQSITS